MIVTVESRINVAGQWWDVVTEHEVQNQLSPKEKVKLIRETITGLKNAGLISRVNLPLPTTSPNPAGRASEDTSGGAQSAAFTWPPPTCDIHREPLKVSNTQKKPGKIGYFCPKKWEDGYCKNRAEVDETTGEPQFWSVS